MGKKKDPAAVALGKKRMAKLTKAERQALGQKAIAIRWERARQGGRPLKANKKGSPS
jgi:hypothetical protein